MYSVSFILFLPLFASRVLSSPFINERAPAATGVVGPNPPLIAASPIPTAAPKFGPEGVSPAATVTAPTTLVSNLDPSSPTYTAIVLQHHNVHRANHSAARLTASSNLAVYAKQKSDSCQFNEDM